MTASTTTTKQLVPQGSTNFADHFWTEQDVSVLLDMIEKYRDNFEVVKVVYGPEYMWDDDSTLLLKFYRYETDEEVEARIAKTKARRKKDRERAAAKRAAQEERERKQYEKLKEKYGTE